MRSVRPRRTAHPVLGWPTTNATHRRLGVAQTPDTTNQRRGREKVSLVCLSGCLFVCGLWPGWGADPQGYTRHFCELYEVVRGFEDDIRHRQHSTVPYRSPACFDQLFTLPTCWTLTPGPHEPISRARRDHFGVGGPAAQAQQCFQPSLLVRSRTTSGAQVEIAQGLVFSDGAPVWGGAR